MSRTAPRRLAAGTAVSLALLLAAAPSAFAHAPVPDGTAVPANGSAVIHVRIPHGCGEAAVTGVSVQLPDGVVGARPQWIPGWTAETTTAPASYTLYGQEYTERVATITWTGGPLPDGQFLDFGISATFQLEPGTYPLPVVQRCGTESVAWIEVAADGQDPHDLAHPAPTFTVVAASTGDGHHAPSEPGTPEASEPGDVATLALPVAGIALVVAIAGLLTGLRAARRRA